MPCGDVLATFKQNWNLTGVHVIISSTGDVKRVKSAELASPLSNPISFFVLAALVVMPVLQKKKKKNMLEG